MKFLWLTWKDYKHPDAGGAEVVLRELAKQLVADGHAVTFLTAEYTNAPKHEILDGIEVIRVGKNRYAHSAQALMYYMRHLRNKFDVVIEVVNTAPYFGALLKGRSKAFVFYHQLAREVWFYETRPPVSQVGYFFLEPVATWLLSRSKAGLITVSESTKQDLSKFGWKSKKTHLISEGIELEPVTDVSTDQKYNRPTMLSLGAVRSMKRTHEQIKAFELAKQKMPHLHMKIAGAAEGEYGQSVLNTISRSPYAKDIEYLGKVSRAEKLSLMQKAHVICVTSVKEGWGLIVTEAASQGTPAVVYDVDGLRDSVRNGETGLRTNPNPYSLSQGIVKLLNEPSYYKRLQRQAWEWSKQITFQKSYQDFKKAVGVS